MKKQIKNKIWNKTWKKCLITFLIIFIVCCSIGVLSINYLNDIVSNNHVHTDIVTVQEKIYGDNANTDYYIVVGTNNKTYSIVEHGDGHGQAMFDSIHVGDTYRFIVKEPNIVDINHFTHIMQVHNVTSQIK